MINKNCKSEEISTDRIYQNCETPVPLTEEEAEKRISDLQALIKSKQYKDALTEYRSLANMGYTRAEREYAAILEKGQLVSKNLDLAMKYFYRAALKNDAYSAYRYSRLASRTNQEIGSFWLTYSAVLGCVEAYPEVAEEFSRDGYLENAHYFTWLAASCDDTDSIVSMAKIYYEGIGTAPSAEYAKWYMDKLRIPPIYAIKLAYKLRNTISKEPPPVVLKNYDGLLYKLAAKAKECSFDKAYFKLSEMLAERGSIDAEVNLAEMLIEGRGCKQNVTQALKFLTKASALGSVQANLTLGDLYFDGEIFPQDTPMAIQYYRRAGELGAYQAYEIIAEIYYTGSGLNADVAKAIDFYDLAASSGSATAKKKSNEIKRERSLLFEQALTAQAESPEDAFRFYSLASSLGHSDAKIKLAECLENGIGAKANRKSAFLLYKQASLLENPNAHLALARCYSHGIGTRLNYKKARELLRKAEELGVPGASSLIAEIMERKRKKLSAASLSTAMRQLYNRRLQIAKKYLEAAAYLQNPKAIYTLGCLYEFGLGVDSDKNRAYEMYEKAFALKFRDPRAKYKLAILRIAKSRI